MLVGGGKNSAAVAAAIARAKAKKAAKEAESQTLNTQEDESSVHKINGDIEGQTEPKDAINNDSPAPLDAEARKKAAIAAAIAKAKAKKAKQDKGSE